MSANLLEHIIYSDAKLSDLDKIFNLESKSYDNPWTIGILRDCLVNHYVIQIIAVVTQDL